MKTARPRMESPFTVGMAKPTYKKESLKETN